MSDYAVFLRGVNVGGVTIKSADLKQTMAALPVTNVKTLLASGNVVCSSDLAPTELKSAAEQALRTRFGYEAWVVVLDADAVSRIVSECPFPADDPTTHTYLTLFSDPAVLAELVKFAGTINEPVHPLGTVAAAWQSPKGQTLESPLNAFTNKARFKSATTTRNIRTMQKVLAALVR
ncbi:DUF1697 domain-containing protein [Arthrobacter tecti]